MDSNHRSTGYEPVGISWLPHPATGGLYCVEEPDNGIMVHKGCAWKNYMKKDIIQHG
ncbi:MAG: hypothetical protein A8273_1277 [Methanohalophilus sp. 2-GBenrich]|nr:MAG: hypothetical protein A8273_1277 [Methanohalophilus sp. 2-GBenrich]